MPGFRPKRNKQTRQQAEVPEPDQSTALDFSYLKMKASNGGPPIYAMTFEQIIEFIDEVTDKLGPGEESAMHHLNQMRRIFRRYLKYGDGNPD